MAQSEPINHVPPAQAGIITDDRLDELIRLSADMENDALSHEGGTMLLMCLRPALEELQKHRQIRELRRDTLNLDLSNVHFLQPQTP